MNTYVSRVLGKPGPHHRVHAVVFASGHGLVRPGGQDLSSGPAGKEPALAESRSPTLEGLAPQAGAVRAGATELVRIRGRARTGRAAGCRA